MTTSKTRAAALCALLASTILVPPALAQTAPAYRYLDENGVDLVNGGYVISLLEGSIGSGDAELSLIRRGGGNGNSQWDGIFLERSVTGGTTSVWITLGIQSERFLGTYPNLNPTKANGSSLTINQYGQYIYRTSDGKIITFSDPTDNPGMSSTFCFNSTQPYCKMLPSSISEPNGKVTYITWDLHSICEEEHCDFFWRLGGISNSFGYSVNFTYADNAPFGQPTNDWFKRIGANFVNDAIGGAAQASVSYAYPSSGITEFTDIGGKTWRLTHSLNGSVTGIRRPGATTDTTTYSGSGSTLAIVREGVSTSYLRSISGSTVTMIGTNALSQQRVVTSDLNIGRPTSDKDELNRTTSYQYDGNGRLTRITMPEGNYVQHTLDARGNVTQTQIVSKPGSGAATLTTSASFNASCTNPVTCNKPNTTTDARGNVIEYSYDATHGGVVSIKSPAPTGGAVRPETRYGYMLSNGKYLLTGISECQTLSSCMGGVDEVKTSIAYNNNGLPITVSRGAGNGSLTATTAATYDAMGNLLTLDGPLAGAADTVRLRYNTARQRVGVISADPDGGGALKHRAQRATYNPDGQVTAVESAALNSQSDGDWAGFSALDRVEITYDANARKVKDLYLANGVIHSLNQYNYDGLGRLDCAAQRMNSSIYGSLPGSACTLGTAGSFGSDRIVKNTYDAASQMTKLQSAYGTADQADEVTATYSSNGKAATVTDAEGNMTTYEYDGHDRLAKMRYPSPTTDGVSSTTDYEQLAYDPNGNVTSRRLRDGQTIAFTYDNLNRMTLMDRPGTSIDEDISYSYDLLGHMLTSQTPSGHLTYLGYDALGRVTSETTTYGGIKTSQYDLAGRLTRLTWPDAFYVTYERLVTGEVSAIKENGTTALGTYSYDDLGRRVALSRGNGTTATYGYDYASRLAALTEDLGGTSHDLTLGFSYNPANQITSNTRSNDLYAFGQHYNVYRPYTANGLNQYLTSGSVTLGYDGRGNLISSGSSSYTYTQLNQLSGFPGGQLYYDSVGRLDLIYGSSAQTTLDYDGMNLVTERPYGSSTILRRYVHGPGTDEPLVWYEGSGTSDKRWLHADERGSVVAVSNTSGNVIGVNRYDEYGIPESGNIGRFQYTGQAWIPELGMYYYKARIYSPTLGRFMQTDPIGYGDGMNMYAYVGNDPVNGRDPRGLAEVPNWTIHGPKNISADKGVGISFAIAGGVQFQSEESRVSGHSTDIIVVGNRDSRSDDEDQNEGVIIVTGNRIAQLIIPLPGRRISPIPPWILRPRVPPRSLPPAPPSGPDDDDERGDKCESELDYNQNSCSVVYPHWMNSVDPNNSRNWRACMSEAMEVYSRCLKGIYEPRFSPYKFK